MLGVYAVVKSSDIRLGLGAHARRARRRGRAARRVLLARVALRQPDHAAADLRRARAAQLEPRARLAVHGHVRALLPRRRSTSSTCAATTRCDTGFAFLPLTLVVAALSIGDHGAAGRPLRRASHAALRRCSLRSRRAAAAGAGGRPHVLLPRAVLRVRADGLGAGPRSVPLLTIALAEVPPPTPAWRRGSSTSRCRSPARSAWRCSARSRPTTRRRSTAAGIALPRALTGGYHLAFVVAAGCVGLGILAAFLVLRPPAGTVVQEVDVEAERMSSELVGALEPVGQPA